MRGREDPPPTTPPQSGDTPPVRILIVDDEIHASNVSAYALRVNGYEVTETQNPLEACELARKQRPDVIILDIIMPDLDGISLAHRLRDDNCDAELMFVTSRKETETKVRGLEVGDQYLTKPFFLEELLAMVGALVRRRRRTHSEHPASHEPADGLPIFDAEDDLVTVPHGRDARLTPKERAVLHALVEARGETVAKTQLLRDIWRADGTAGSLVEVNVLRLRKKIEINPRQPELIMTTPGGYYYNVRARVRS